MNGKLKTQPVLHASVSTRAGSATIADATPDDVEAIVRYWHDSGDDFLDAMGIDRARRGSPADTRARYTRFLRADDPGQASRLFAIGLDGRTVGFTLLNRYAPEVNYSHWHIVEPGLRGAGISSALYPYRIRTYFALTPIARLIHQTRTRNVGVNRMLDKWVPVAETRHVENPDGFALPGEFHIRYVRREDVPRILAQAET